MSLFSTAERLAAIDRSTVVLHPEQCLHSLGKLSVCEDCFAVCPVNAIQPGTPPSLESDSCQTCLACIPVCPAGAYSADDAVPSLLACVARLEVESIELLCELHHHADAGVTQNSTGIRIRGCLAGLGAGTLMALAAMGLEQIILRTDACAQCPWGSLHKHIQEQVDKAGRLLVPWRKDILLSCVSKIDEQFGRPLWDAENPPLSRRDLFRMAARQGQVAMARAMTMNRTPGERRLGRDRLRIIGAVSHLPEIKQGLDVQINTGGFADLSVSTACSACRSCVQICPTKSLQFKMDEEERYYWLQFTPNTCINCGFCGQVCAPEAIDYNLTPTFSNVFFIGEPITLSEGELTKCDRCGAVFAAQTGKKLCPVCEYRRKNPFGSMLPPGIKKAVNRAKGEAQYDS